jgi:hypothetical protein
MSIFSTSHWHSIVALTLTYKQAQRFKFGTWVALDDIQIKKTFRHFLHSLNRAIYKNAYRYHRKRLRVIPVLEKSAERWHIHASIELPPHISPDDFEKLVRQCWKATDWGYTETDVKFNADKGWTDYTLKPFQKKDFEHFYDSIVWELFNNPNC